ncbi:hypothetical protein Sango_2409600 [Sesamum angolense]|uniref:Uncharacterized protein n=1 Tax=Sesamum angolense TaxID=2727404 RepID=A0AAE1W758_9LAMI|nr:hypothetical protein Sango_2409600 [Sesamum angolense]
MNSKKYSLRPFGQRSIASTFLFRASNRSSDCEKNLVTKAPSQKGSHLSLSDFLNRSLHRSSVLPSSVQGKELHFSSALSGQDFNTGAEGESGKKQKGEAEVKLSIDGAFDMFKNVGKEKSQSHNSHVTNETEIFYEDDLQQTRKRRNLSEGDDDKPPARKRLVVLGEDLKPTQNENGAGWWDDQMEGVDNEEVGCNDVWEGVGCTTLGGRRMAVESFNRLKTNCFKEFVSYYGTDAKQQERSSVMERNYACFSCFLEK